MGLVVDGDDHFSRPIEGGLRLRYNVDRFAPQFVALPLVGRQVNERLLDRQLRSFIRHHDVTFFEWAGSLLARASRLPKEGRIVARLHSVELATSVERVRWSQADHLIVLNRCMLSRLREIVKEPLPAVSIVANGVDLTRFRPQPRRFHNRLGMVCSLLPIKRVYEVILCLYVLRRDGHQHTLHIAGASGEGDARRYIWALESLVERLGLQEVVTFYGHVDDVARWLQSIDVFISNSYWEGQQVALIEAMAAGCYCLSHCWNGIEEILPADNVFVTESDLRRKLVAYAQFEDTERSRLQARLRAIVEDRFDERRMVSQVIGIIETLALL